MGERRSASKVAQTAIAVAVLTALAGNAPTGAESACSTLQGNLGSNGRCQGMFIGDKYQVEYSFPDNFPDQQGLTRYLSRQRDEFIALVADRPPRNPAYVLEAKPKTYSSSLGGGTTSLVLTMYSESGGAHPVTYYKAFNSSLASGRPIAFNTVFRPGSTPLSVVAPIVKRDLENKGHLVPSSFDEAGPDACSNFALTDSEVIFFFGQGDLLSQADGPLEVSVPRSQIGSILA